MKRLFLLFFSALLCTAVSAHDFKVDGIYYNITSSSELTVGVTYRGYSSYEYSNEYSGSVVIPEKVTYDSKEYSVTSIGDWVFDGCSGLASVTIPNSVTSIGWSAFNGCSGLTAVHITDLSAWCKIKFSSNDSNPTYYANHLYLNGDEIINLVIPDDVTSIGEHAFSGCSGLTSVTIPNSVTSIGDYAFSGCSGLTSVTIPNSVTRIGNYAFSGCSGMTSVTIPNSVTSIGSYAFRGCSGMTSVTIPNSVTSIENNTFLYCSGMTSVTIPNSVTSIGYEAFYGCSGLTSINIPNSVTSIGNYAFYDCSGLTSVTIPNSVTSIGNYAFYDCSGLTSVTIPNSVTSIGYYTFYGCSGLTSVTIPNSVTSIGNYAFYDCSGLTSVTIPNSVTSIGERVFSGCSGLTSVTIPNSVTSIGEYAFSGCSGLTSVTIPNSVTSIGERAFDGCSALSNIRIEDCERLLSIKYTAFMSCPLTTLYMGRNISTSNSISPFFDKSTLSTITISNSVTDIGACLFRDCSWLAEIEIPNSVTSISSSAFSGCTSLTNVSIPNSVTSIGERAFDGCSALSNIRIEDCERLLSIKYTAFMSCPLTTLYMGRNISTSNSISPFFDKSTLSTITISNSVTDIGACLFRDCSWLTEIEIPNSVTSISSFAFSGCTSLTNVPIPNSVTSIGSSAFSGCTGLANVPIPNSVTSIGSSAFSGCTGLSNVSIPNSVTNFENSVFEGCFGLKSLRFEDGEPTLTLPDNFPNTIDSLHLGRNITSKSSYFNTGENNLSILSIGKHVISLDDKMFYNCSNITKVICYATEPPMIYPMTFYTDIYGKATLSVPGESMEKYRNADVWKKFSKIEEIDNNPNATDQCAAPVITYADGKLQFACETAGAECKYTLTAKDIQTAFITASNNSVDLTACYDITAYAVAEGYKNSEQVTATLYWINGSDVSTNINQTEMRGVMATCSGGIITVSGLTDGETVMFYDANGALLYTGSAQNGTVSYAPSASGVIIVKIGKTSIKVVK